jgi:hypothetical protein
VVVGFDAHCAARRLWTNLASAPLISAMIGEAGSYAFRPDDSDTVQIGTLRLWDDAPAALETERERLWMIQLGPAPLSTRLTAVHCWRAPWICMP